MSDDDTGTAPIEIDKVRASKAGHAFHEAWAARTALELLPPSTDLTAITLEGFDERDEHSLGTGAVEIADLVRHHGATDVARAHRATVVQFKYSIQGPNRQFELLTWHQLSPSLPRPMPSFARRMAMTRLSPGTGISLPRTGPSTKT